MDILKTAKELKLNKNETREIVRIRNEVSYARMYNQSNEIAQRSADIWIRSASATQVERRKAAIKLIGLDPDVKFL